MTKQQLLSLCLSLPGSYEDYPFHDDNWAVIRHKRNKKSFAYVYERNGQLCINLKCPPMEADFYRSVYPSVTPGFHMNHQHWNTVAPPDSIPLAELQTMLQISFQLTAPKIKKRTR